MVHAGNNQQCVQPPINESSQRREGAKDVDQSRCNSIGNHECNRTDNRKRQKSCNQQRYRCHDQQLDGIMHPLVKPALQPGEQISGDQHREHLSLIADLVNFPAE